MRSLKKILFITFIFFTLFRIAKYSYAQTSNCGFAGVQGSDKCCEDNIPNTSGDVKNQTDQSQLSSQGQDALKLIPGGIKIKEALKIGELFPKCYSGDPNTSTGTCICKLSQVPTEIMKLKDICKNYIKSNELLLCENCAEGGGILTGMGCIPLNLGNFINNYLLGRFIGLAGLMALLCIIYSAVMMQLSQGNPEKIKKVQQNLTSCILGLILIIFSTFILKLIGIDILGIPLGK